LTSPWNRRRDIARRRPVARPADGQPSREYLIN
jgi:hypothetical protein